MIRPTAQVTWCSPISPGSAERMLATAEEIETATVRM